MQLDPRTSNFSSLFRHPSRKDIVMRPPRSKRYGCLGLIGDFLMICITGGLWLIWVIIREIRYR